MIESEPTRALIRPVPDRYTQATVAFFGGGTIDVDLARDQHRSYATGLRRLGLDVIEVPPAHRLADSVFVEDTAVVVGNRALVARSAHSGRRPEAEAVGETLAELGFRVVPMSAPASLDGGDVLRVGRTLFVSRTSRTNDAGIRCLDDAFPELTVQVVALPPDVLHLKCVCSSPAPGLVLVTEGTVEAAFAGHTLVRVPQHESYAANTVGARGQVLVSDGYPITAERLSKHLEVVPLATSEFRKGDGSLTCLSILLD